MRIPWLTVLALVAGCAVGDTKSDPQPLAIAAASPMKVFVPHDEPELGLRFPLATKGTTFKMWHFDPTLPPAKFRHEIQLSTDDDLNVVIDVWDNPDHLDVREWVAANLSGVFDSVKRTERPMSRAQITGILFEMEASEQSTSESMAVFATRDRVFRFLGLRADEDASSKAMFDKIVNEFETTETAQ